MLRRVASVEEAIGGVSGGIAKIMGELATMGLMLRDKGRTKPAGNVVHMHAPDRNCATSNPSEWQHCTSQSNPVDMAEGVTTPNCPEKEPPGTPADPPGTEVTRPILVDSDNMSNDISDNIEASYLRKRTQGSLAQRVHSQPRLRVVPPGKKMLCAAPAAAHGESSERGARTPPTRRTVYKDPPGYSDVRDFGDDEDPGPKPPLLQPKNHGVSRQSTIMPHRNSRPYTPSSICL